YYLVYLYMKHRDHLPKVEPLRGPVPMVTIQLPLYNEMYVADRLIDAVCRIDYPRDRLEIQVLDDSTDETSSIIADAIQRSGVSIAHVRRESRDGFKAGALAHGMRLSTSELFAVFDADFVPPRDLLLRMVPYFANARVGMVQARWTHLNRDESLLTRVQALFLDAHFAVESAARNFGGRFFNFNGTAGIWRRAAIEEGGGWSSSTLTEDLDLSYRAQLAGWEFVFLNDVEVPAELPAALSGFQDQQHRWAKGSIQTARKLLGTIVASGTSARVKSEAVFHLTNNSAYLFTVLLALLIVPSMLVRYRHGLAWMFLIDVPLFIASTGSVLLFYREGQRWAGRARPPLRELLAVLPVGVGMSMRNAVAVLEGLIEEGGHFKRTPKAGDGVIPRSVRRVPWAELAFALFFAGTVTAFAAAGHWAALPFLTLFLSGYSYVVVKSVI
ncbi:MAG: cellulose synthase family protein, partial [Thermoanaerobaculia bacterium]